MGLVTYFGSKARLASRIVELMPSHRVYLEPYAGSAAVLLAKPPAAHEVLNDTNLSIVTFFRMLRDAPAELERVCRLTPYARDEYLAADLWATDLTDLERARRFWVRSSQSVSGIVERRTTWSGSASSGASRARTTDRKLDQFAAVADRLRGCIIDHRDAIDAIRAHANRPDALVYADPPYPRAVRAGRGGYDMDADDADHHRALAVALHETPAMVVLSGYDSPLYAELYGDWHQVHVQTLERAGRQTIKGDRTEVLWTNYVPSTQLRM